MRDESAEILFQSFLQEALVSFWHEQGCPLFDVVHPAFPLTTTTSPTLQGVPKDGFGEAVVACDMLLPFRLGVELWTTRAAPPSCTRSSLRQSRVAQAA